MFDFIRRLFGHGKVRVNFTTHEGRAGSLVIDYTGDPATLCMESLRIKARDMLLVEHGLHLKDMEFVGITTN